MSTTARPGSAFGIFCILGTLMGWASVFLFLKFLSNEIDPWTANGWRYGLSALLWLPVLLMGLARKNLPAGLWKRAIVPAAINCVAQVMYAMAPYYIGAGFAAFLVRVSVVSSLGGAFLLFSDERILLRSPKFWIGLAGVVLGSCGTIYYSDASFHGGAVIGIVCGAASGLLYGCYSVSVRYFMRGVPSLTAFAAICLYTAAGLFIPMLIFGREHGLAVRHLSGFTWTMLLLSAFLGIAMGHVLYYSAIARLGVAVSNGILQVAPFLTAIGSLFIFDEQLSRGQWLCGAILFIGAVLLLIAEQARHRKPANATIQDAIAQAIEAPLTLTTPSAALAPVPATCTAKSQ